MMVNREMGLAVFAKTPKVSPLKTRLRKDCSNHEVDSFYLACLSQIYSNLSPASNLKIYWALAEPPETPGLGTFWLSYPWPLIFQGSGSLGNRLHQIQEKLLAQHSAYIFVGSDMPHLTLEDVAKAKHLLRDKDCCLGPAEDGGFYLFASKIPLSLEEWMSIPYSSTNTSSALMELCLQKGMSVGVLPQNFDVDRKEDYLRLKKIVDLKSTGFKDLKRHFLNFP